MGFNKSNVLIFLIILLPLIGYSQVKVNGRILDSYNGPTSFAKVQLASKDSIYRVQSDSLGLFELEMTRNTYTLKILKEQKLIYSDTIIILNDIDLGDIIVDEGTLLDEVVIAQRRKLIERKIDRLVFNVENSVSSTGSDALEVLGQTPGIRVQNDNVKIIGKSNMLVMIDDRLIELSGADLMNFLKTISSESIKEIEVITAPPAKYDASGNSGLINIKLKKAKKDSWNSTMGTSFTQRYFLSEAINGNFNYNKNKLTIQSAVNLSNAESKYMDQVDTYFIDETWREDVPRKIVNKSVGYRVYSGYDFTAAWNMGIILTGSSSKVNTGADSRIDRTSLGSNDLSSYIDTDLQSLTNQSMLSINYHNIFKLDTIGTKIVFDLDYFNYENDDSRNINGSRFTPQDLIIPGSNYAVQNYNNQDIKNYSGKLDVEMPLKWASLTYGGKYSVINTKNNLEFYNIQTSVPVFDPSQSNKFNYRETNQALYFSGNKKVGEKWEIQAAVRVEATQTKGYSANYGQENKNDYIELFPTAYVQYSFNEDNIYSINYSRRIFRPSYQLLNPFRDYDSQYSYVEGNPFLQPSFSNTFEFSYTHKNFDTKLSYSQINDGFEHFGIVDPVTNITRYTVTNFLDTKAYNASLSHTFDKVKWWTSANSIDSGYSINNSSNAATVQETSGYYTFVSTNNDFILNKTNSLILNLSYWYQFRSVVGVYEFDPYGSFSTSVKYKLKDNLQLSLNLNDVFKSQTSRSANYSNGIRNEFVNYYDARHIRFSLQYKIGKSTRTAINKDSSNTEEQNRTK